MALDSVTAAGSALSSTATSSVATTRLNRTTPPQTYDLERGRAMAALATLAYEPDAGKATSDLKAQWGFSDVKLYGWGQPGAQAFIAGNKDTIVLSFRGTEDKRDIEQDLQSAHHIEDTGVQADYRAPGQVGRGFANAVDELWDSQSGGPQLAFDLQKLAGKFPNAKIYVTGHSLGGAMAQIAASRLEKYTSVLPFPSPPGTRARPLTPEAVYTYGAPPSGNQEFADAYNAGTMGPRTFRHVDKNDPIPMSPCGQPVGHLVQIDAANRIIVDASSTDRPPSIDAEAHRMANYSSALAGAKDFITRTPAASGSWGPPSTGTPGVWGR